MVCLEWEAGGKLCIEQKHYLPTSFKCLWPFALPFSRMGSELSGYAWTEMWPHLPLDEKWILLGRSKQCKL